MYVWKVGSSLSSDSNDWSDFGGFLGGIGSAIGPVLTVAGLLFVWWQGKQGDKQSESKLDAMNQQHQVMANTLNELVKQTSVMREQLAAFESQANSLREQVNVAQESSLFELFSRYLEDVTKQVTAPAPRSAFDHELFSDRYKASGIDSIMYDYGGMDPILKIILLAKMIGMSSSPMKQDLATYFKSTLYYLLSENVGFGETLRTYIEQSVDLDKYAIGIIEEAFIENNWGPFNSA